MKRILILLLALAMMFSFAACSGKNDADADKGGEADATDGTSLVGSGEDVEPDKAEKRRIYTGYTRTDGESGDVSIMEKYTFDGTRVSSINVDGESVDIKYDDEKSTASVYYGERLMFELKWDEMGDVCESTSIYSDDSTYTYLYERDSDGRVIKAVGSDGEGKSTSTRELTYNENGDILTEVYHNIKGEKTVDEVREYDEAGNLVKKTDIDFEEVYVNAYDEAGNLISVTNDDGSYTEYTYGADGNMDSRTYYREDGTVSNIRKYTYYPSGELHTESYYYSSGDLNYTYTYNYSEIELTDAQYRTAMQIIDIVATEM